MLIPGIPLVLTLRVKNVFDQKIKKNVQNYFNEGFKS